MSSDAPRAMGAKKQLRHTHLTGGAARRALSRPSVTTGSVLPVRLCACLPCPCAARVATLD